MMNFSVAQNLINAIIEACASQGVTEDELNYALLSLLNSSMRAGRKDEHTLCNDAGELLILAKRYK